jgi:predicted N-acetyltransferase YhbS
MMEFYDERVKDIGIIMTHDKCAEHFDLYSALNNVTGLVAEEDGEVVGVILASVGQMFGSNTLVGTEIVWYVRKDKRSCGVRLLRNMENKLRELGCKFIMMIGLEGDKSCEIYPRLGYRLTQNSYLKGL